jgi:DNA-binding LytR/AlgR family response regulator
MLDILMPGMNGIELGKKIREMCPEAVLVYLTTSKDYAVDAYSVYAYQYIVKPVEKESFERMMNKFTESHDEKAGHSFPVKTSDGVKTVFYGSILCAECRGHVVYFHLTTGETITSSHIRIPFLQYIAPILEDARFVTPHKSYAVNLDHASRLEKQTFLMADGSEVPISRNNYQKIKSEYLDHVSQKVSADREVKI